ncbi:MAG: YebC/PmpR family DNA-binding transcriptional regulator [Planctomycetota bacterium]
MGRAFQNRKESMLKTSIAKAKVYSRAGREIYVCAKAGGPDPETNAMLKGLIDRAKRDQVPTSVIDRAIEKATGGGGEDYAAAYYEGYGPGGTMVIVECLTDNPTRTFNEVRHTWGKGKGKMGNAGSVSHMFDHCGILRFAGKTEDEVLESLLEADVDVTNVEDEDSMITVFVPNTEYHKAKTALAESFGALDFDVDEIQFLAQNPVQLTEQEDIDAFTKFLEMIEELDDVQKVFHSAEL